MFGLVVYKKCHSWAIQKPLEQLDPSSRFDQTLRIMYRLIKLAIIKALAPVAKWKTPGNPALEIRSGNTRKHSLHR